MNGCASRPWLDRSGRSHLLGAVVRSPGPRPARAAPSNSPPTRGCPRRSRRSPGRGSRAGAGPRPITATRIALKSLTRRILDLGDEIAMLDELINQSSPTSRPSCSSAPASASRSPGSCSSPPATTPIGSAARQRLRCSAVSLRYPHRRARPSATASCRESPVVDLFRGSGLHVWARLVREGATGPALRVPAGVASCG